MNRIDREKTTVKQMIEIYCHGKKHVNIGLCEDCSTLLHYAYSRLEHCKYGNNKPTCKKCPIHCYKPEMRQHMRFVMRYAGPRMLWIHPIAAIKHIIKEL